MKNNYYNFGGNKKVMKAWKHCAKYVESLNRSEFYLMLDALARFYDIWAMIKGEEIEPTEESKDTIDKIDEDLTKKGKKK